MKYSLKFYDLINGLEKRSEPIPESFDDLINDIQKDEDEKGAIVDKHGNKKWVDKEGQFHRVNGPAIILANGNKHWFKNGLRHREDGPAIERSDGSKSWYINGILHREDGPAIEQSDGSKIWYKNGLVHRDNGPAIERFDGSKEWYLNGKRHREDGPAVEQSDGTKFWWLNGKQVKPFKPNKLKESFDDLISSIEADNELIGIDLTREQLNDLESFLMGECQFYFNDDRWYKLSDKQLMPIWSKLIGLLEEIDALGIGKENYGKLEKLSPNTIRKLLIEPGFEPVDESFDDLIGNMEADNILDKIPKERLSRLKVEIILSYKELDKLASVTPWFKARHEKALMDNLKNEPDPWLSKIVTHTLDWFDGGSLKPLFKTAPDIKTIRALLDRLDDIQIFEESFDDLIGSIESDNILDAMLNSIPASLADRILREMIWITVLNPTDYKVIIPTATPTKYNVMLDRVSALPDDILNKLYQFALDSLYDTPRAKTEFEKSNIDFQQLRKLLPRGIRSLIAKASTV